jgi:DNA polymerase-1
MDPFAKGDTFDIASIQWVLDEASLTDALTLVEETEEVVIDLETTGLDEQTGIDPRTGAYYPPRIVMAALTLPFPERGDEPVNIIIPLSHPEGPWASDWERVARMLAHAIRRGGAGVTNHNIKFDLRWLYRFTGVDLSARILWDTNVSSHSLDENESTKLKEVAPRTFGIARWDEDSLASPGAAERVPFFTLGVYAARDTYWTWKLAVAHRALMGLDGWAEGAPLDSDEVEHRRLGTHSVWCAMPMVATLTRVEQDGILLDQDWTRDRLAEVDAVAAEEFEQLVAAYPSMALSGVAPNFASNSRYFTAWTEQACAAGDLAVTATTPSGKPSWNKMVLRKQAREGSEVAARLRTYGDATKQAQFLRSWLEKVGPDGRIHAGYRTGFVVTGRLSSSNPNLQQVSKKLRPAFIASPGFSIVEVDYSQVEVRLAAYIAECGPLIDVYREGRDVYIEQAAAVLGISPDAVTPEQRQRAKAVVLGFMYGMGEAGFQTYAEDTFDVVYTLEESIAARAAFFSRWEGMAGWHAYQVRTAVNTGQVVSPLGRVRRLPGIHDSNPKMAGRAERQAINSPVQSMASDVMQMAAADVLGLLPGSKAVPDVRMVATVHDSLVMEVPAGDEVRASARVMQRMSGITDLLVKKFNVDIGVPLPVEAEIGDRWGAPRIVLS